MLLTTTCVECARPWCAGQAHVGSGVGDVPQTRRRSFPRSRLFCAPRYHCGWYGGCCDCRREVTAISRHPRSRSYPIRIARSRANVWPIASSSPRDHPGGRICCLASSVSSIGQLIETASRALQPLLDRSRCRFLCCLASLGSFLAIISRRQRWRVLGLVHEPQHSRDPADRELSRPLAKETTARDAFLTLARAVG
jgi:hypothetical protein